MEKKYPDKARASVKRDLTLLKNSIEKSKSVYMKIIIPPNRDPTFIKPGSRFGGTFFSHINVSSRFAGTFLFTKCMCDISKKLEKSIRRKA